MDSPKKTSPGWAAIVAAMVLVGATTVQFVHVGHDAAPTRPPHLAGFVPGTAGGWTSHELPIGPNEFLAATAEKVLNYDEVLYREYSRGSDDFALYVAYWGAGKMPTQLVAYHNPDQCWTANGWKCLSMRFGQTGMFPGIELQPAEWRLFEPPVGGNRTYVLFWHLVDGRAYDYGDRFNAIPDPVRWWRGAIQQALYGEREQYFIRLTSSQPLEKFWTDPGFREVVQGLSALGLAQPAAAPHDKSF